MDDFSIRISGARGNGKSYRQYVIRFADAIAHNPNIPSHFECPPNVADWVEEWFGNRPETVADLREALWWSNQCPEKSHLH